MRAADLCLARVCGWGRVLLIAVPALLAGAAAAAPSVTTNAASGITVSGATLNGTVSSANITSTYVYFDYGTTTGYGSQIAYASNPVAWWRTNVAVSAAVTGLNCGTTYHFRVEGQGSGTAYGNDATFTTSACPPSVTTGAASGVSGTGATLNGTVSSNGTATTVTFDYGTTTSYGSSVSYASNPLGASATNAAVSAAITGLACGTTYHFRVDGSNAGGTVNGSDAGFTTPACAPSVTTGAASGLAPAAATLNGTVSSNGAATTVTFEYGITAAYGTSVAYVSNPLGAGASNTAVSTALTGLTCNTLYHYRVDGSNSAGTTYGGDQTFTTSACLTAVTLTKTASTAASVINSYVSFTIVASNGTAATLNNVVVTDTLPTGMNYSAGSATQGTVGVVGQTVTWTIPSLSVGYAAQLTLVVQLTQKGNLTNSVTSPGATSASASILVLPSAITSYHMDEPVGSWTGATGEVIDSGGNGLNGHRRQSATTTTNTVSPSPTIASQFPVVNGGFCNAGYFDGNAVVESASSPYFQFTTVMSASAWIYPTAYPSGSSDLYSIMSNDVNYEFHLDPNGHLYWWWNSSNLTSAAVIPLNQWTHVAITMDSTAANHRERIYINGVQDANVGTWSGTLAVNNCPFYIGGDISTGSNCTLLPQRSFHGMIDEASIYDYEMSAAEVQASMTLGRQCSGTFDHIEIDHDGSASVCTSKTVTLKACLDAGCTVLYPGVVSVQLSPTGWTPTDVVTFGGGVATATLANSAIVPPSITLGSVSVSPTPARATVCYNGTIQTCTLSVASASCNADAVEVGANPYTNLYTKLAGAAFNVDLLSINSSGALTSYTGAMVADIINADTGCSASSTALNTAQSVTFSNQSRKTVSLTCPVAARRAQVRMKIGTSYACSTDKFAIRPSGLAVSSNMNADATGASATATPILKAGSAFTLNAAAGFAGYDGTPAIDATKLTAHAGAVATGSLTGVFSAAVSTTGIATGNSFAYGEVGYFGFATDGVVDSSFTAVDQPNDCTNDFSNTTVGGKIGCKFGNTAATGYFGRFIPDHFDSAISQGCASGAYTYSGQPFDLTLTARNGAGAATQNYNGSFAKTVTLSEANGVAGGTLSPASVASSSFASGVATLARTAASPPKFTFVRGTPDYAPATIKPRAADSDGASSATGSEATALIRVGRLRLSNVYGYQSPLIMPVAAQYWTGNSWLTNGADNCTALAAANLVLSPVGWAVTAPGTLVNGLGSISLTPAAAGTVAVCADLAADHGVACSATSAGLPWLQSRWPGAATYDNDPGATATFDIFSPEGTRGVYQRELY